MEDITVSKRPLKKKTITKNKYITNLVSRILIAIIFLLVSLIFTNQSSKNLSAYKSRVLVNNFRYNRIKNKYEKMLGKVIPSKKVEEKEVFKPANVYDTILKTDNGEKFVLQSNTLIEAIQSGIVVYIGEKEDYGNTIIVQGIDDVDIWYSNIAAQNIKLYDYVEKNTVLGEVQDYLLLNIIKNDKHFNYEEYIKSI